ncbi:shieldin complex subunit 1 [Cygnus atratus]|uniref:shieldin complex subunit 1 n=1 Tax=Cygnus atratus TaxID=8868 RepID=UPI0021B7E06F|nr:shieldin complex subunit 1 [Cygnus atratus]
MLCDKVSASLSAGSKAVTARGTKMGKEMVCQGAPFGFCFFSRLDYNCGSVCCSVLLGESNPPSAVSESFSAGGSETGNVRCYPEAGLCEHTEPNDASLSSMYEHENTEDTSIRKSLDGFYETYCKNGPGRADPTCEAASRCLSQKVSELANRGGTKYALRCLQMAQVVLNRDGCKIFPNYPTTACFSKPAEGEVLLEDTKRTPGLSDDVLQFLLKQTRTEHSPDVLHEK